MFENKKTFLNVFFTCLLFFDCFSIKNDVLDNPFDVIGRSGRSGRSVGSVVGRSGRSGRRSVGRRSVGLVQY